MKRFFIFFIAAQACSAYAVSPQSWEKLFNAPHTLRLILQRDFEKAGQISKEDIDNLDRLVQQFVALREDINNLNQSGQADVTLQNNFQQIIPGQNGKNGTKSSRPIPLSIRGTKTAPSMINGPLPLQNDLTDTPQPTSDPKPKVNQDFIEKLMQQIKKVEDADYTGQGSDILYQIDITLLKQLYTLAFPHEVLDNFSDKTSYLNKIKETFNTYKKEGIL